MKVSKSVSIFIATSMLLISLSTNATQAEKATADFQRVLMTPLVAAFVKADCNFQQLEKNSKPVITKKCVKDVIAIRDKLVTPTTK
ncbi:hypothetical protein [Vibrio porteresiae]|uniref:Uncharacterized protein n=1 Tax=Vibrio porteresiae DSM 19223 TaxID=1123496 RepID=A0ABZ0QFT7_9VIBR|nr:hypothetical protein [Vibrio porteresiae]WPC75359.1 hypothetical protein R8Z52_20735 [Vibrio porteresiae DSM 19223]